MRFVTQEEAQKAANRGKRAAIKSARRKWRAFWQCNEQEFRKAKPQIMGCTCALCWRYRLWDRACPFSEEPQEPCEGSCSASFGKARDAYDYDYWKKDSVSFAEFQAAAKEVWQDLGKLL